MKLDKSLNILIIGLGLLGGSYAISLKRQGYKVEAIETDPESCRFAVENNMVDRVFSSPEKAVIENADLIIFALYPHIFREWIKDHAHLLKSGVILTDVTGVKTPIIDKINSCLPSGVEFIAAHPMAGREVCGIKNSDDSIFKGANYIVVPTEKNTDKAIKLCKSLGETLGFKDISELTPEKHDDMIAFLSQLTHCIAISLMCSNSDPDLVRYTGDSFRDLTRIANINDEMWSELFLCNRDALLKEMDSYRSSFDELYNYIKSGNREAMRKMMLVSSARRRKFDKR